VEVVPVVLETIHQMVQKARIPYSQRSHLQAVAMVLVEAQYLRSVSLEALEVLVAAEDMLALVDRGTHQAPVHLKEAMVEVP
jgi:hypothetical protein